MTHEVFHRSYLSLLCLTPLTVILCLTILTSPAACALCQKILLPDDEGTGELEPISMCGDCKFLFLEDLRSPAQDSHWRRPPRVRRTRYSSSESIENLFSQHFSHMINLVRQNQSTVSGHEDQLVDVDPGARLLQRPSSRTTPSGSRRWRRVPSDTESDGFDNLDSLYGESESNISYGGYRLFNGESDAISFSAYGGDSDASVDGHSFLDTEMYVQPDDGSNLNSDTDIDPMHARLSQWNSDDQDEDDDEEDEEDDEWEEADPEENVVESAEAEVLPYFGNSEDYLDARGFEEFLEHLAETDSSRRGAPPAAVSFVNSLPRVVINEEHEKRDGLVCAICKDVLSVGTEVNQLPCFHLYHPYCILPWLTARNSCPLCRYELPTDDKDYEEGKLNASVHEIPQQDLSDDSSSDTTDGAEADDTCEISPECRELADEVPVRNGSDREGGRGRWFFLAAAPIARSCWHGSCVVVTHSGNGQKRGNRPF
ncbi:E3 ubiquitin-protein ligase RING1-like [Vitis vinifera]|uniref:RING-type E3 ubiquitin transferase n=1 Tax=Vitis vinifera TaxID=29760 RepID=A0A438H5Q5_VITVI|nr:E3 ubiquitin-protein ligase RING1-like [Vitis vinifera]